MRIELVHYKKCDHPTAAAANQSGLMSGAQDHAGGVAGLECFLPAGRT